MMLTLRPAAAAAPSAMAPARWASQWAAVKRGRVFKSKPHDRDASKGRRGGNGNREGASNWRKGIQPERGMEPAPPSSRAPPQRAADGATIDRAPNDQYGKFKVTRTASGRTITAPDAKPTAIEVNRKSALSRALAQSQRKKLVSAKKLKPHVDEAMEMHGKSDEERRAAAMEYAAGLIQNVPRKWLAESSVVREALGLPPSKYIEAGEEVKLLGAGDAEASLPPMEIGGPATFEATMSDLESRVARLEELSMKVREREGLLTPRLAHPDAYLRVIERAPTGVEAASWLDELEMLKPEWLTPDHYEAAFALATEEGAPLPERDVMVMWLKARQRNMLTSNMYAHMFHGLGKTSLRAVAFPFVWESAKADFGVATMPMEVCEAVFQTAMSKFDVSLGLNLYMELARAGCRIGLRSYFRLVRLVTAGSGGSGDQDVFDFLVEEMQQEAARVIAEEPDSMPPDFFAHSLIISSPNNAIRLWHFMRTNGIRVTQKDYINLFDVMARNCRNFEAEEIMKYLSIHHPDFLWADECRIPKLALRMYALRRKKGIADASEQASALYYFSEYFGPESGTRPDRSAYMQLIRAVPDTKFVFEIWREMLARGIELETDQYNMIFSTMNQRGIARLRQNIPYQPGDSALYEEMPREMQERIDNSLADVKPLMPPATTDIGRAWDIYDATPSLTEGNDISKHATMGKEMRLIQPVMKQHAALSEADFALMKRSKKRHMGASIMRTRQRRRREAASGGGEETASAA